MSALGGLSTGTKVLLVIGALALLIVPFPPIQLRLLIAAALAWALTGLTAESRWRRQVAAIAIAALVWMPFWLLAVFVLFGQFQADGPEPDFRPSVVLLVIGLVVGVRAGWRAWPRTQVLEPSDPGG